MEVKFWVISQLAIDVALLGVIVMLLRARFAKNNPTERGEVQEEVSSLIQELNNLGGVLERNLEEKKRLTDTIVGELDKRLEQAEEIAERLGTLLEAYKTQHQQNQARQRAMMETRKTIETLLAEGLSKEQISKRLSLPVGELDLILKLQPSPSTSSAWPADGQGALGQDNPNLS